MSCLGWDSNPQHSALWTEHSRQSALPLSYRGSSAGWAQILHLMYIHVHVLCISFPLPSSQSLTFTYFHFHSLSLSLTFTHFLFHSLSLLLTLSTPSPPPLRIRQVPSVLLSTSAVPASLAVRGRGCMVQTRVCCPKRKMKGEENAYKVSKVHVVK